jgi:hypothetical protein
MKHTKAVFCVMYILSTKDPVELNAFLSNSKVANED